MPKASDIKKGSVVELDGEVYIARQIDIRNPSARGASTLYKIRFFSVRDGKKLEQTLKGDDFVKDGDLTRRSIQFSYSEGDMVTFMDSEDFSQYTLNADALTGQSPYMTEDLEGMIALIVDGQIVGVEIPQAVVLEITQTDPGIKTASVSARTKPATLSTGLEIQVPEYLESGEQVKVNTSNGKYISRG
ncbi:MAG: elongation factor P-like protein YeiP [Xanthomonadales bacterium]|nr:elongation factor P-like protein YeiP [Xanthomonadales bacterium]